MAVVRCENGHYYDDEKYQSCPHCKDGGDSSQPDQVTVALESDLLEDVALAYVHKKTGKPAGQHVEMDEERTIGIYGPSRGTNKVVGWLVCVDGSEIGRDFPLHSGFNRIGRGFDNDVILKEDMGITREEHCSIVYEERKNLFYLVAKPGNLVYLDDCLLETTQQLEDKQEFVIGQTKLRFVALCIDGWKWNKDQT